MGARREFQSARNKADYIILRGADNPKRSWPERPSTSTRAQLSPSWTYRRRHIKEIDETSSRSWPSKSCVLLALCFNHLATNNHREYMIIGIPFYIFYSGCY